MDERPRNPGRRFEILALVDGRHPAPEGFPEGWTSAAVAGTAGIARSTAHHLLARLRTNDLVEATRVVKDVRFRRALGGNRALVGTLDVRPLVWSIRPKGEARLDYRGGHGKWCPLCGPRRNR